MSRSCCVRVLDALCPCCRRRARGSSASSGAFGRHDMSLNFILHGECNVGKTSLRNRWVDGIFTGDVAPTFGVDFNIKTLDLVQEVEEDEGEDEGLAGGSSAANEAQPGRGGTGGGRSTKPAPGADLQVKINVYDTSGKPGYREVNSTYLLAFDAVLFVYDISSMSSLHELRRYFNDPEHRDKLASKRKAGMAMLLVGNKSDVPLSQRQVGSQTGQDTAAEFGIPFVEVSAKTGANVREAFMFVTTRAVAEHLARDRLLRSTDRARGETLERTMQRVPGLQRAMRARASVLDVFRGMTGRRKYIPKEGREGEVLAQRVKGGEDTKNEARKRLQLPKRPTEGAGSGQLGGDATPAFQKQHLLGPDLFSPGATETAANSPVAQSGTGGCPTSTLLERPEASPAAGSMFERVLSTIGGGSRPPRLDTSGGSLGTNAAPATAAAGTARTRQKSPRRERRGSPGGSPRHARARSRSPPLTSRSKSPAASSSSCSPTAVSPRQTQLDPELVVGDSGNSPSARAAAAMKGRGQVTRSSGGRSSSSAGGSASPTAVSAAEQELLLQRSRPGRASPERTAGGGVEDSATRQLKDASSFWLDKWGIKAAKTDATRERHRILKPSPSPPTSPRGGLSIGKI